VTRGPQLGGETSVRFEGTKVRKERVMTLRPDRGLFRRIISLRASVVGVKLTVWDKVLVTGVVIAFVVHMSMTKASLQLLTCRTVAYDSQVPVSGGASQAQDAHGCSAGNPNRRLLADLEVCCGDPESQVMMYGLGFPGLVVYAFGIPFLAAWMLWYRRERLSEEARTIATLGFLYAGFKKEAYFWESVIMLRKVAIAAVAVFLAPAGAAIQTYAGLMVIFCLTSAHLLMNPFERPVLNRLEFGALVTAFLTFECGLFVNDSGTDVALAQTATVGIFVVNGLFLLAVLIVVSGAGQWCVRRRALKE